MKKKKKKGTVFFITEDQRQKSTAVAIDKEIPWQQEW
jgi:hypothetical protein